VAPGREVGQWIVDYILQVHTSIKEITDNKNEQHNDGASPAIAFGDHATHQKYDNGKRYDVGNQMLEFLEIDELIAILHHFVIISRYFGAVVSSLSSA
jgi:hypothetical protein